MSSVAAIGAQPEVVGFGLVGVRVCPADTEADVRAAWQGLPEDVAVVILTEAAARALDERARSARLTVVIPP